MGIEQLIQGDLENDQWQVTTVIRTNSLHSILSTEPNGQIVIDEAIDLGMSLPIPTLYPPFYKEILLGTVNKTPSGVYLVSIAKVPPTPNVEIWCMNIPRKVFDNDPFAICATGQDDVIAQLCHKMVKVPNNPLELHWRFGAVMKEPVISIVGLEKVKKVSEIAKYTKALSGLLPAYFGKIFKTGRGRKEDLSESIRITREAQAIHNRTSPAIPWWQVANEMGTSESNLYYHMDKAKEYSK